MEEKRKGQKANTSGAILARCPLCKGAGKVPKQLPFGANPKAPATRPDRLGMETCPRCEGRGRIGVE